VRPAFFLAGGVAICLLGLAIWRYQGVADSAPDVRQNLAEPQAWPPVIDDAPRPGGYYAYVRFDADAGPFQNRDLPAVYLERAKHQTACFSGRVDGRLRHIVVASDFGRVSTHDPETDAGWAMSGCSDALVWGSQVLTTREYWQTRLKLLPDTPENAVQRQTVEQQIKTLRPWWWPRSAQH